MNTTARVGVFAGVLAIAFAGAYGIGSAVGPTSSDSSEAAGAHGGHGGQDDEGAGGGPAAGGLQISKGGYTLDLKTPRITARERSEVRFAVLGKDGSPVTAYEKEHGKELHFIVASRDLTTYRHLHPTLAEDGTWSIPVELPRAGDYRVFADFVPDAGGVGAQGLTLGADLAVAGDYAPQELPEQSAATTVDGYTVTLGGTLAPGRGRDVTFTVEKDGKPVTDLQPYLGAYGHLVALRAGDLAYLHVHPNGEPGDGSTEPGPDVAFTATAPSAGAYRLFLDFKHDDTVRTAAFTVRADGKAVAAEQPEEGAENEEGAEHEDGGHGH